MVSEPLSASVTPPPPPGFQAGVTSTIECVGGVCDCNYMCIRRGLEQLGLVILPAFVILMSEGGRYRDMGVLPRDVCYRGPKGTQQHL